MTLDVDHQDPSKTCQTNAERLDQHVPQPKQATHDEDLNTASIRLEALEKAQTLLHGP